MDRDDVIRMAREAGGGLSCIAEPLEHPWKFSEVELIRFARLVAAHERDGCLQAVNAEHLTDSQKTEGDIAYDIAIEHAAAAIRQRGSAD